jgi:MHS family alpha-ketoglutarate permease-like MFS transporter
VQKKAAPTFPIDGDAGNPYTWEEKRKRIFAIIAASSGNLVEWFDFYIYAFCSIYFASAFFPKSNPTAQLMDTAGVFAAGFLMRPVGRWLFGRLADRKGRNMSMVTSVVMMCWGRPSHWPLSSLPPR